MTKKFEELVMTDDFMFGKVMENNELCRHVLEILLQTKIETLEYPDREKEIRVTGKGKSVRLDIFTKDEHDIIYDAEMQNQNGKPVEKLYLSKRSRFYQSLIDSQLMERGTLYRDLNESYVIFLCTFDPFGEGKYQYTFRNICEENTQLSLNDKSTKVFFNITADRSGMPDEIRELFDYLEKNIVSTPFTEELEREVEKIRFNEERRREYMKTITHEMDIRLEGRDEGIEIGQELLLNLIQKMAENGEAKDIPHLSNDEKFLKMKMEQYGIAFSISKKSIKSNENAGNEKTKEKVRKKE
ncbi:MAG: Rpn family recombination-promoting nuclease/putative transposase [Lachnospiraceae bacterium]